MNNRLERRAAVMSLHEDGKSEREIAELIGVSRATVFNDLKPLKVLKSAPQRHARHADVVSLSDEGKSYQEIAEATGIGGRQVRHIVEREHIERAAQKEATALDWDTLPGPTKDKLEVMRRQVRRELQAEFEAAVVAEVQVRMDYAIKAVERRERDVARVLSGRKGIFTAAQYRLIKACLHPDGRDSVSPERLAEAFCLVNEADILLMDNKEHPLPSSLPPIEELLKRRRRNAS